MKRGFHKTFVAIQLALVAGLAALVEGPAAILGASGLATPGWRLFFGAYVVIALAWAVRTGIRRLPELCIPFVSAARRLERLDAAQRVYPAMLLVTTLIGTVCLGLWMLGDDLPRAFFEDPSPRRARQDGISISIRFVLFEAFMVLDASLALVCTLIVGRRRAHRSSRQASP